MGLLISNPAFGQERYYFGCEGKLWYDTLNAISCHSCVFHDKGFMDIDYSGGFSYGPDNIMYALSNTDGRNIYEVDLENSSGTLFFDGPDEIVMMGGFVAMGGGIFYSIPRSNQPSDSLYIWDTNAGTVTSIGQLSHIPVGEMWLANGELYYMGFAGANQTEIVRINIANPSASESVVSIPSPYQIIALTASPDAALFFGADISSPSAEMVTVNIVDGTINVVCDVPKQWIGHVITTITSLYEHQGSGSENFIDLDCDDSSMATNSDYNGSALDCFTEGGIAVCDTDVVIRIDAYIETMTIEILNPEDGMNEILTVAGPLNGLMASGEGTATLTLISEGAATIEHLSAGLQQVRYDNLSLSPTGGVRSIAVHFITQSGNESNTGIAYLEVIQIPQLELDLGPDLEICEGSSVTVDATTFGAAYSWSTGESTASIEVSEAGVYAVTITSITQCPNSDEIEISLLPEISLTLTGDTAVCEGASATLIITSNAPFPVDIEIISIPGFPFSFSGVEGVFEFVDVPFENTQYMINEVIPSQPSCMVWPDDTQFITVLTAESDSVTISLCEGDSVLIGNNWYSGPGIYSNAYQNIQGCDSIIITEVMVSPTVNLNVELYTCDTSNAGEFITHINNPQGCDTIITTLVSLLAPDTSFLSNITCRQADAGVFEEEFQTATGCDSIVITTITWAAPSDTTFSLQESCDSAALGISFNTYASFDGCDSIVQTLTLMAEPDTTHVALTSCNVDDLGVFVDHFTSVNACDSVVIKTITFSAKDSTYLQSSSCNPADTGLVIIAYQNVFGCDSIVFENITIAPASEVFVQGTTCDPDVAGNFVNVYVNQFGCDSIVHEDIMLLPSHATQLSSSSCKEKDAGVFITAYTNQFGCDSIVTHTVSFLPGDTTQITLKTCNITEVGTEEYLLESQNGCDSLVVVTTDLHPVPQIIDLSPLDHNGYHVSCFGGNDAVVVANVIGTEPLQFSWSDGSTEPMLSDIPAGYYSLTVTDANGCMVTGSLILTEPQQMNVSAEQNISGCSDSGGVMIVSVSGGVQPYEYAIKMDLQTHGVFDSLAPGVYEVIVSDKNGCTSSTEFEIEGSGGIEVSLGEDITVSAGESVNLEATINVPLDSLSEIIWTGAGTVNCYPCVTQTISAVQTTMYAVSITGLNGCTSSDTIIIFVQTSVDIFVPNIFSPGGDNANSQIRVFASREVQKILDFTIYDRWGEKVFSQAHFDPGDVNVYWDGTLRGVELNPGVFVYQLTAQLTDLSHVDLTGNITLIR